MTPPNIGDKIYVIIYLNTYDKYFSTEIFMHWVMCIKINLFLHRIAKWNCNKVLGRGRNIYIHTYIYIYIYERVSMGGPNSNSLVLNRSKKHKLQNLL